MVSAPKFRMLIFSHDEEFRNSIQFELASVKIDVDLAENLETVVELLKKNNYRAILASALEPMFEGLRLAEVFKRLSLYLQVVLVLSPYAPVTKKQAVDMGFSKVLLFPFTKVELQMALQEAAGFMFIGTSRGRKNREEFEVKFKLLDEQRQGTGKIVDLSRGGAKVRADDVRPKIGERLSFSISVDSPQTFIVGTAVVRWTTLEVGEKEEYTFGVKFLSLDEKNLVSLKELLSSQYQEAETTS